MADELMPTSHNKGKELSSPLSNAPAISRMETRLQSVEHLAMKLAESYETGQPAGMFISVREVLDELEVPSKGRRRLNQRIGNALRRHGIPARRCAVTSRWLFSSSHVHEWLRRFGSPIIQHHIVELMGQFHLPFTPPRIADEELPASVQRTAIELARIVADKGRPISEAQLRLLSDGIRNFAEEKGVAAVDAAKFAKAVASQVRKLLRAK